MRRIIRAVRVNITHRGTRLVMVDEISAKSKKNRRMKHLVLDILPRSDISSPGQQ
jgi:hypothetical protein